jgi:hypothetical protein
MPRKKIKPNWTNRKRFLTKKEMNHLSFVAMCHTKTAFQGTINTHARWRKEDPSQQCEPCWVCRSIAEKLNMEACGD